MYKRDRVNEREIKLASTKVQSEIVPHMEFDLYSLKFYMKANYQRAAHMLTCLIDVDNTKYVHNKMEKNFFQYKFNKNADTHTHTHA